MIMSQTTNLNIKIDRDLKIKADRLFNEMGMTLTTAVNVFVRQAVLERAIPFRIQRGIKNARTVASVEQRRAAMQEIRDMLSSIDGNSIDLTKIKTERRAVKFEHNG